MVVSKDLLPAEAIIRRCQRSNHGPGTSRYDLDLESSSHASRLTFHPFSNCNFHRMFNYSYSLFTSPSQFPPIFHRWRSTLTSSVMHAPACHTNDAANHYPTRLFHHQFYLICGKLSQHDTVTNLLFSICCYRRCDGAGHQETI